MHNVIGDDVFWNFSTEVYQAPLVEDGLLLLQDRHGLDVNIVLLCCWLGGNGVRVKNKSVQRLIDETLPWRTDIIEPLRKMRRAMKRDLHAVSGKPTEKVRKHIKEAELAAEKFQQEILVDILSRLPGLDARDADRAGLMRSNLLTLLAVVDCKVDRDVIRPLLERLIVASCKVMDITEKS